MKLDRIKSHPDFPFVLYRENDLQFLMLEMYWAELLRDALPEAIATDWRPEWPADAEDGNPILSVSNRAITPPRMLRVIQRSNDKKLPELDLESFSKVQYYDDAYVPFVPGITYGGLDQDMVNPIEELVISSAVSASCERLFRYCVQLWCVERVAQTRMEEVLASYWTKVRASLVELGGRAATMRDRSE